MIVLLSSPQWPPQVSITDPTRDQSLAHAKKENGRATAPRWLSLSPPGPACPDHRTAALYQHQVALSQTHAAASKALQTSPQSSP